MPAPQASVSAANSDPASNNTLPPPRRAATLPTKLQTDSAPSEDAETLFAHPQTTIVAFNSSVAGATPAGWGTSKLVNVVPWSTRTERVVAAGLLRLYRLKNSEHVCFLHSGQLLLSLLPRSQVWCVDGVSKFAIRIQPYIYRIELPAATEEDKKLLEDFTSVLSKVLYYERTPCPFKRGFEQEDAEDLPSPAARRSLKESSKARKWELKQYWRPEGDDEYVPHRPGSNSSAESVGSRSFSDADINNAATSADPHENITVSREQNHQHAPPSVHSLRPRFNIPEPARSVTNPAFYSGAQNMSRNGSPQRSLHVDASASREAGNGMRYASRANKVADIAAQFSAVTIDSPGSLPSIDPESPTTPLAPSNNIVIGKRAPSAPDAIAQREVVIDPEVTSQEAGTDACPDPALPASKQSQLPFIEGKKSTTIEDVAFSPKIDTVADDDAAGATEETLSTTRPQSAINQPRPITPPNRASHNEADPPSTLPQPPTPSVTIPTSPATPGTSRKRTASPRSAQRFRSDELPDYLKDDVVVRPGTSSGLALALSPAALVQKTCALLLGPPSGLVQIMVQIAARLRQASTNSAFRVPNYLKPSRALPGSYQDSDDDDDDEYSPWKEVRPEDEEDDFGVSLGIETPARERRRGFGLGDPQLAGSSNHPGSES